VRLLRRFDADQDGLLNRAELSAMLDEVLPGCAPAVDPSSFDESFPGGVPLTFLAELVGAMGPADKRRALAAATREPIRLIEFINQDTGDLILITGAGPDGGLTYLVNGLEPRPPFRTLAYRAQLPSEGTEHVLEFADIGRALRLPVSGLAETLSDLRRLCQVYHVEHNITDATIAAAGSCSTDPSRSSAGSPVRTLPPLGASPEAMVEWARQVTSGSTQGEETGESKHVDVLAKAIGLCTDSAPSETNPPTPPAPDVGTVKGDLTEQEFVSMQLQRLAAALRSVDPRS